MVRTPVAGRRSDGQDVALRRHLGLQLVLAAHLVAVVAYGAVAGSAHLLVEAVPLALLLMVGSRSGWSLRVRTSATSLGLYGCSALVVHLFDGLTEAHFHFFVVLALVSLYRDIVPYVVGIAFVLVEHLVVGTLEPDAVFQHDGEALRWALVHAGFVGAVSVAHIVSWRTVERSHDDERQELNAAIERLAAIVDDAGIAIVSADFDGTIRSWNTAAGNLFGYSAAEAIGASVSVLLPPGRGHELAENLACVANGDSRSYETQRVTAAGTVLDTALVVSPVRSADGAVIGVSVMVRDITARKKVEQELASHQVALARRTEELRHLAFRDPLTGLPNRTLFLERLEDAHRRRPGSYSVIMLDLDGFKKVNDTAGHAAGDALLAEVAARLQECVRPADTVARLGGDEFALLVEGYADPMPIAARVLTALGGGFDVGGRVASVTGSLGVAVCDGNGSPDQLLRSADVALYAAKGSGKNRAMTYDAQMLETMMRRTHLEAGLRTALADGELNLHYQPVVDLQSGEVEGFEALLRWQSPTEGSISAAEFVPLAEESGQIIEIGAWVLREATQRAVQLSARARRPVTIAVNVSTRQLERSGFPELVASALAEAGLPPQQLVLEVTESALAASEADVVAALRAVRSLGVLVAIDDFGTGYSSLDRLRTLPVDQLKVDRSFISEIPGGRAASGHAETPVLAAIFAMAAALGLRTVAEGVETDEQYGALRRMGCHLAQGYLMSRPVPATEAGELLAFSTPFVDLGLGADHLASAGSGGFAELVQAAAAARGAGEPALEPLLAAVCAATGLESAFLTAIDVAGGTQTVLAARNAGPVLLQAGDRGAWTDSTCRAAALSGRWVSSAVPADYPTARTGSIRSYAGVPLFAPDGSLRGTLCAADSGSRLVDGAARRTLVFLSRLIVDELPSAAPVPPRTVVLVDDSEVSRRLLEVTLETLGAYRVVGRAGSVLEAVDLCRTLRPDLVLLDAELPDSGGQPAVLQMTAAAPGAQVVVISGSDAHCDAALADGAWAFLNKAQVLDSLGVILAPRHSGDDLTAAPSSRR